MEDKGFSDGAFHRLRRAVFASSDWEIAELALERGWITEEHLDQCAGEQAEQDGTRLPLRVLLVIHKYITAAQLVELTRHVRERGKESAPSTKDGVPVRLGRFEILRAIGSGGMAHVYLARDPQLERQVALKVIRTDLGASAFERFGREAIAAARLRHPGIIAVHEVGADEGRFFIAMDYHDGGTFHDLIRNPDIPFERKIERFRDVVEAIRYAHAQGVIHRDLKPSNILLDREGRAVIADFGLARIKDNAQHLTVPGTLIGTVDYMSPEQSRGGETDERSDLYSLGVILYEILTGGVPFHASDAAAVLRMIQDQEPIPPRKVAPRVARDIEIVCLKALEKDPGRRYASAEEFARDLALYLLGEPIRSRGTTAITRVVRRMRKRAPFLAVTGVLVAAVVGLLLYARATRKDAGVQRTAARRSEELREAAREESKKREEALEDLKEASRRLEKAVTEYLHQPGKPAVAEFHRLLGEVLGLVESAAPALPDHPDISCLRARVFEARGNRRRALDLFDAGIRRHPDHGELLAGRARLSLDWHAVWT